MMLITYDTLLKDLRKIDIPENHEKFRRMGCLSGFQSLKDVIRNLQHIQKHKYTNLLLFEEIIYYKRLTDHEREENTVKEMKNQLMEFCGELSHSGTGEFYYLKVIASWDKDFLKKALKRKELIFSLDEIDRTAQRYLWKKYEELDKMQNEFFLRFPRFYEEYFDNLNTEQQKQVVLLFFNYYTRCLDQYFIFADTNRAREMFNTNFIKHLVELLKLSEIQTIVDVFSNIAFTRIIAHLFRKKQIILNDIAHVDGRSLFQQNLRYILELHKRMSRAIAKKEFYELEDGERIDLHTFWRIMNGKKEERDAFQAFKKMLGKMPRNPIAPDYIILEDLFLIFNEPMIKFIQESETEVIKTSFDLNAGTEAQEKLLKEDVDLVIVDPPFGWASKEQGITEEIGRRLFENAMMLCEKLKRGAYVIIRIPKDWTFQPDDSVWFIVQRKGNRRTKYFSLKKR